MIQAHIAPEDLRAALSDLSKYKKHVREDTRKEIMRTAYAVNHKAKSNCPIRTGRLKSSLKVLKDNTTDLNKISAEVGTNVHYAPYVEFGTGTSVSVPTGLEDYAMQFKGRGIRKVNIRARPYLFPAAESERSRYVENLRKILSKPK